MDIDWDNFEEVNHSNHSSIEQSQVSSYEQPQENHENQSAYEQSRSLQDISLPNAAKSFCIFLEDSREEPIQNLRFKKLKEFMTKEKPKDMQQFYKQIERMNQYEGQGEKFNNFAEFRRQKQFIKEEKRSKQYNYFLRKQQERKMKKQNQIVNEDSNKTREKILKMGSLIEGYNEMKDKFEQMAKKIKENQDKKENLLKQLLQVKKVKKASKEEAKIKHEKEIIEKQRRKKQKNQEIVSDLCNEINGIKCIEKDAAYVEVGGRVEELGDIFYGVFEGIREKQAVKPKIINYFCQPRSENSETGNQKQKSTSQQFSQSSIKIEKCDVHNITSPFDINLSDLMPLEEEFFTEAYYTPKLFDENLFCNIRKCLTQKEAVIYENADIIVSAKSKLIFYDQHHPIIIQVRVKNRSMHPLSEVLAMVYIPQKLKIQPPHNYHEKIQKKQDFNFLIWGNKQCLEINEYKIKISYSICYERKKIKVKGILPLTRLIKPEFIDEEKLSEVWCLFPNQLSLKPKKIIYSVKQLNKLLPFTRISDEKCYMLLYTYPLSSVRFIARLQERMDGKYEFKLRSDSIEDQKLKEKMIDTFNYLLF